MNNANCRLYRNNKTGFKGVWFDKDHRTLNWKVVIQFKKRPTFVGRFKSAKEAAERYNQEATRLFGEFAHLNVIPP